VGQIDVPPAEKASMITEGKAGGQLKATVASNAVELLFITEAPVEQALPRPMAHLNCTMFVLTHEAISASL